MSAPDFSSPPWVVDDNRAGHEGSVMVWASDGQFVSYHGDMEDCEWRAIADARLIAAAPDLLEAVDRLLNWWRHVGGERAEDIAFAQRALAKARGEEQP